MKAEEIIKPFYSNIINTIIINVIATWRFHKKKKKKYETIMYSIKVEKLRRPQ